MVSKLTIYNVSSFLDHFHKRGFKIMVLRGYEGLPDNYGGDLDIEIPAAQYQSFIDELLTFSRREGLRLIKYVYRPHVTSFKFYRVSNGILERFILDISCRGGMWYGFSYLGNEELFAQARSGEKWLIPDSLHELVLKIFTNMLIGGSPPKKYFVEISSRLPSMRGRFVKFVGERFPGVDAEYLYYALIDGDECSLNRFVPRLRFALIKRGLKKAPLRNLRLAIFTIFCEIYFYLQMNGLRVELSCNCSELQKGKDIVEMLKKSIGHVWKRVVISNTEHSPVKILVEKFDLFRDRLVLVVRPPVDCGEHNLSKEIICMDRENIADIVWKLYQILERRNELRKGNIVFRTMWSLKNL